MIGLGDGTIDTPASSATWKCAGLSRFCRIVSQRPRRFGSPLIRRSGLSPAIVVEDTAKRRPRRCRKPCRLRIAWHLMENASRAFLDAVRKSIRQVRSVVGATTINPELLTAAERIQHEGYQRREETNTAILALLKNGMAIKQIVYQTGHSRKLVRQVIRGERNDVFRTRQSSLDVHLPWLDDQWASGCRNSAELWRRLATRGFRGSLRVVGEWATRRRRAEKADAENLQRVPSARTIARLMTIRRDTLSKAETVTVAAIEAGVPALVEAREIIVSFNMMIRRRAVAGLTPWIGRARASLVASFGSGVTKDEAAVRAAITLPWSNGQTEGQITRLKLVRRQMYGRGKIDLLQARLIGAE
jgi:transposase